MFRGCRPGCRCLGLALTRPLKDYSPSSLCEPTDHGRLLNLVMILSFCEHFQVRAVPCHRPPYF